MKDVLKDVIKIVVAVTIILIVFIICASVLIRTYILACAESRVKMFADPKYEERIRELEKDVEQLKERERIH